MQGDGWGLEIVGRRRALWSNVQWRSIDRAGTELHALWRPGRGNPVVVVPGVMADADAFAPVVDAFDRPEPVLLLNRRGRHPSGALGPDYSVAVEVADLTAWVEHLGAPVTLVGWSYGATVALEAAARGVSSQPVLAYEPVLAPFGAQALPALRTADLDRAVEIVNVEVSGFDQEVVWRLRDSPAWAVLRPLAAPLYAELSALDAFVPDARWRDVRAELILGELNQGTEPYGTAFARVAARLPASHTTILPGQGHLAHAEDPGLLGRTSARLMP